MSSRVGSSMSSPSWGAPPKLRWRVRGGVASDLAGGSLLLAAWVLLWAFFVMAVAGPAARPGHARGAAPCEGEVEIVTATGPTSRG